MSTIDDLKAAVDSAQAALDALLPTQDEYGLAALRVWQNGTPVDDLASQQAAFGADKAAALRASLVAKEVASPAARRVLTAAQLAYQQALPA